ncbi:DUF1294-domain-containing protein [Zopfia rhizophila CBS 207.26]|uniref:DUF1294-domain-containing protein n=1 Tax=Zopfia rhizophila CBS 207.26 TaxID=1314779 RepID=A0A6A6E6T9_9PEZI|nr:DUF1294-domain-containing protein [Zopfia rhizophila CBS 207.26]
MPPRPRRHRPLTTVTALGLSFLILPAVSLLKLYTRSGSVVPLLYTGAISFATFMLYGYDKMQARNLEWRVKEVTLHTMELLGGWPGALVGQHYFQHKRRKMGFQIWFWGIVMGWQVVWWVVWNEGVEMG